YIRIPQIACLGIGLARCTCFCVTLEYSHHLPAVEIAHWFAHFHQDRVSDAMVSTTGTRCEFFSPIKAQYLVPVGGKVYRGGPFKCFPLHVIRVDFQLETPVFDLADIT